MKKIIWIILCLGNGIFPSIAQDSSSISKKDLLFKRSHHTVFFSSFLSKGSINREQGEAELVNQLGFGFTGGWLYTHNFSPKWGVETGFTIGVLPFKYSFNLEADRFGLPFDFDDYYTQYHENIAIPIHLVFRQETKHFFIVYKTGLNFRYIVIEEITGGTYSNTLDERVFLTTSLFDNTFRTNLHFSVGIAKLLPNYNFLTLNLVGNLSFRNYTDNSFYLFFPQSPDHPAYTVGTYDSKGSYIGLSLGYTMTRVRKALKKLERGR